MVRGQRLVCEVTELLTQSSSGSRGAGSVADRVQR